MQKLATEFCGDDHEPRLFSTGLMVTVHGRQGLKMPAKLRVIQPARNRVLVTVGGRRTNAAMGRAREYLDPSEVKRLVKAAKKNRHGVRDALMI
jgi:hypothetical protein